MSVKETLKHAFYVLDESADYYWALTKLVAKDKVVDFKYFVKSKFKEIPDSEQLKKASHEFLYEWNKGMLEWQHMNNVMTEHARHEMEIEKEKEELVKYFKAHEDEF